VLREPLLSLALEQARKLKVTHVRASILGRSDLAPCLILSRLALVPGIAAFKPQDATTNPSLVYNAAQDEKYIGVVQKAVDDAKAEGGTAEEQLENAMDHVVCCCHFLFSFCR
jgi:hypothetical protein